MSPSSSPSPFSSILISPADFHSAKTSSFPRRILPVAAGRASLLPTFQAQHIPNSIFFNMDLIADTTSPYPQMLPTAAQFAASMRALGVRPDDILVVYDTPEVGMYSAPRVAWTCRFFGHADVHVMNNFRVYVEEGYPVEMETGEEGLSLSISTSPTAIPVEDGDVDGYYPLGESVTQQQQQQYDVIAFDELRDLLLLRSSNSSSSSSSDKAGGYQIIDARIPGRFSGSQDEMDPSLRSGHMPRAVNVPLAQMLDADTKAFLPVEALRGVFADAGVRAADLPLVILTCNSGVTAAALDLALRETGLARETRLRLYDGSWMEWTRRAEGALVVKDGEEE
ncbi:hypothetical protein FE257_004991 [Aspergillus nanangensis]|uniref:Rhodanese domain-containing protein n=1 Tax=Aspergillus nanangensis TaxID=2582783 RepID=A0AAD4GVR0_ASPNN|nr:hypothetical protein FE257_004991 [Aspergillus nanangensis]